MSEAISRACEAARKAAEVVYVCCDITRYKEKKGEDSRVLVITELFVAVYQYTKVLQESLFFWPDLVSYNYDGSFIEMRFNSKKDNFLKFSCLELSLCHLKILRILESGFAPAELAPLQLDRFEHKRKQMGGLPLFGRYVAAVNRMKKPVIHGMVSNALRELATTRNSKFDVSGLEKWESVANPLYFTLSLMPFLESLVLKASEKKGDFWNELAKSISNFAFLKHLRIEESPDKRFKEFVEGARTTHLTGLSFMCELKKDSFAQIRAISEATVLRSLEFEQSFGKGCTMDSLCSDLLIPCCNSIRVLNFSKMQINVSDIVTHVPHLAVLGLRNCGLKVGEALADLSKLENLRMLDLSGNEGVFEDVAVNGPPRLIRLDATDIKWQTSSLRNFMRFVCGRNWVIGAELFMHRLSLEESENVWDIFDDIRHPTPITVFSWDETEPSPNFISFLRKCPNLHTLSVQSTFGPEDGDVIEKLAEVLPDLTNLRTLILTGTQKKASPEIASIFQSLKRVSSLAHLDISYQDLNPEAIHELGELIKASPNIQTLLYDQSCGENVDAWKDLVESAESRESPWEFMFPMQTMRAFEGKELLSKDDIKRFKQRIVAIQGGDCPDDEEPSDFLTVSSVSLEFPRYLTRALEQVLMIPMDIDDNEFGSVTQLESLEKDDDDVPDTQKKAEYFSSSDDEKEQFGSRMLIASDDENFQENERKKNLFLSDSSDEEPSTGKKQTPPKSLETPPKVETPESPKIIIQDGDEPVMFSLGDASREGKHGFLESSSSDDSKPQQKGFLDSDSDEKPRQKDKVKRKLEKLDEGSRLPGVKRKSVFLESSDEGDFEFEETKPPEPKPVPEERPGSARVRPRLTLDHPPQSNLSDTPSKPGRRRVSAQERSSGDEPKSPRRSHRNAQGEYSAEEGSRRRIPRSPSSSVGDTSSSEGIDHQRRHRHRVEAESPSPKRKSCIPMGERRHRHEGLGTDSSGGELPRLGQTESEEGTRRRRRAHEEPGKSGSMSPRDVRANARRSRTSPATGLFSTGDGCIEYHSPDWDSFPIPRVGKPRDTRLLKELTKEFAISDAINSLKTEE